MLLQCLSALQEEIASLFFPVSWSTISYEERNASLNRNEAHEGDGEGGRANVLCARLLELPSPARLLAQVAPTYQTASRARKHLILNAFVQATGYARPTAIRLLNHPPSDAQPLRRSHRPIYGPQVQQALFLMWKATHYICARRLLPSLPTLMEALEQRGHVHLTEKHRHQVLAMSVSTAERLLRTQRTSGLHGLSTTTPGLLRKDQLSVRTFSRLSG